jgi:ribosomal protein S19E (S16A)
VEIMDPEGILESLDQAQLVELNKDIDTYLHLEQHPTNKDYWHVRHRKPLLRRSLMLTKVCRP